MSQYACSIIDNSLYNQHFACMSILVRYRYGVTLAGAGKPLVCLHGFLSLVIPGMASLCQAINLSVSIRLNMEIRIFQRMKVLFYSYYDQRFAYGDFRRRW